MCIAKSLIFYNGRLSLYAVIDPLNDSKRKDFISDCVILKHCKYQALVYLAFVIFHAVDGI